MMYWSHYYHYLSNSKKKTVRKIIDISFTAEKLRPWYSLPSATFLHYKGNYELDFNIFGTTVWIFIAFKTEKLSIKKEEKPS